MTITLGLTGSIGMGKSAVAGMFRAEAVPVFDADAAVHRLQRPGGALVSAIGAAFPGTGGAQGIDREALRRAVIGDAVALARLEAIVHPAVADARRLFLDENTGAALAVLDVPLLFETGGVDAVDAVVVVSAPSDVQRARVLARPGMTDERFAAILAIQMPDAEKRRRADFVIDTGVSLSETAAAVAKLVACLRTHGVRYCCNARDRL